MSYDVNKLTKLGHLKSLATNLKAAIPTKVSQLTNDAQYQTNAQVAQAIQTAIAATGHAHFEKVGRRSRGCLRTGQRAVPRAERGDPALRHLCQG